MSEHEQPPIIIIKRITKKSAHHGGGWKIAYADFVTAMMAFFMLLWMLSMLNKYQLQGVSNYFKRPMRDLFIDNQLHNTNIPKRPAEHTEDSELAPTETTKDGHSPKENTSLLHFQLEAHNGDTAQKQVVSITPAAIKAIKEKNKNASVSPMTKEQAELYALKQKLEAAMQADPTMNQYKEHLDFKIVDDGLQINISSLKGKPMFSSGKTDFEKYAKNILQWLSGELNQSSRKITIIGHTDTEPYNEASSYSNWELSVDRANSVRRLLIDNGVDNNRIIRVQGAGSTSLLFKQDGLQPGNRRIVIIILTDKATQRFINE